MAVADGKVERFNDDELVVALADLDLVLKKISGHGVGFGQPVPNDRLGLALVPGLTQIDQTVYNLGLKAHVGPQLAAYQSARSTQVGSAVVSPLDLLLKALRLDFAHEYSDWLPAIGKNRAISRLAGSPHVGGGGVGPPVLKGAVAFPARQSVHPRL